MADVAQFGVEVPPVKGVEEAVAKMLKLAEAAEEVDRRVKTALAKTSLSPADQKALAGPISSGIFSGFTSEMNKMSRESDKLAASQAKLAPAFKTNAVGIAALGQQATQTGGGIVAMGNASVATSQKTTLLTSAQKAATTATAAAGSQALTMVKHLAALAAAYFTVHEAVKVFTDALQKAGEAQAGETTLKLMIGNAKQAAIAIQQIKTVSGNVKIFDEDELTQVAIKLKAAGVATQNIGPYVQGLSVLAARAGVDVTQMAQAWLQSMHGGVRSSTVEADTIMKALGATTGRSMRDVRKGLQDGSIGAKEFTSALISAAKGTDDLQARQGDYLTKLHMLGNAWDDVLKEFATPIIDALGPILDEWRTKLDDGKTGAQQWGESWAGALTKVYDGMKKIEALWNSSLVLHDKLFGGLSSGRTDIDPKTGLPPGWKVLTPNVPGGPGQGQIPKPAGIDNLVAPNQALDDLTEKMRDITNDFQGDFRVLIDYWKEYGDVQAFSTDATSRHFHTMENLQKAISALGNPMEDVKRLMPGLSPSEQQLASWMAWREAADRAIKDTELRMRAGMASMSESVAVGVQKMTDAWGTWQEQVSRSVGDIGNALSSGIANGLTEILSGTKSVADGFRDMAQSVIRDIQRIIIQMLVQLAIQRLISAFGGGVGVGAGSAGSYLQFGLAGRPGYAASGGRIGSGWGGGDRVPLMAEEGEFMINKRAAARIGYDRLRRWNSGVVGMGMEDGGPVGQWHWGLTPDGMMTPIPGPEPGPVPSIGNIPGGEIPLGDLPSGGGHRGGGGGGRPSWTNNPPGVRLSPRDIRRILGGGEPGAPGGGSSPGDRDPFGPGGPPGTLGIVNPSSPAGGGSFFGGHANFLLNLPGSTYNLGASGGSAASMASVFFHSGRMQSWAHSQGYGSIGDFERRTGFVLNAPRTLASGAGIAGAGRPMTHSYHTGGIVDHVAAMASGGVVAANEGVFTPAQMARMAPAGNSQTNVVTVSINNIGGKMESSVGGAGMNDREGRELARMVLAACKATITRERRYGGQLYAARAG